MSLQASSPRRERTLLYGRPHSGKSTTWADIADWYAEGDSPNKVYVGSTDRAWDAMRYPKIENHVVLEELDTEDFKQMTKWSRSLKDIVYKDDWVVFDLISDLWEAAQAYYWSQKTGDLLADVKFANQLAMESKGQQGLAMGGAHGANWNTIKSYHADVFEPLFRLPCHLMVVSHAKEITSQTEGAEALQQQWRGSEMPACEKHLAGKMRTWIRCNDTPAGYRYTTVRDDTAKGWPDREMLKGEIVTSGFVMNYLVPVCGWKA